MPKLLAPFRLLVAAAAGRMKQCQLQTIDYLRAEDRVLREQPGDRRLRLTRDRQTSKIRLAGTTLEFTVSCGTFPASALSGWSGALRNPSRPRGHPVGADRSRDREGVPMALRAANSDAAASSTECPWADGPQNCMKVGIGTIGAATARERRAVR